MVKTHYTGLKTMDLVEVGPMGPDGEEIPTSQAYDSVTPAAHLSQKDCALDTLIDGLDRA
jgi:predicted transcriptional regulator